MNQPRSRYLGAALAVFLTMILALGLAACGSSSDSTTAPAASPAPTPTPAAGAEPTTAPAAEPSTSTAATTAAATPIQSNPDNKKVTLKVGSKNFSEEYILGEIYAQALEAAGYTVKKQLNLGSEQIAFKAVKSGQVDMYPEYTGTALTSFFDAKTADIPKDETQAYELAKTGFAKDGLTALPQTPYTNSNAVGMTKKKADELGVTKISDLVGKDFTLSGSPECRQRTDCLVGLKTAYGLTPTKYLPVDLALRHQVLKDGRADASIVFSTDGQIAQENEVVLTDDKGLFPPYNITLVVRDQAIQAAGPDLATTIEAVQQGLTTEAMQELNSRVDLDKQTPEAVAKAYLTESGYLGG